MDFNVKLQELRKHKGLTQEELAQELFVSRTAVSKWESGRGYPSIDSLKAIAEFFSVTVDELLSRDELLTIAQEDTKEKERGFRELVFGLLDLSVISFLFLPFFGQKADGVIQEVSLLSLGGISAWLLVTFYVVVAAIIVWGVLTLVAKCSKGKIRIPWGFKISLALSAAGVLLFIISSQPYAAAFMFIFLVIKVLMLIKSR